WFPEIDVSKKHICYKVFNKPAREDVCSYCPTYKSLKDGQVHESVTETPAGDKIVNYRIVSSPVKDKDGKVTAAIEMVEEITERKKAEEALRESEQRHKALFEGAAEGMLVADIETKQFEYANPAICRMLGYSEEELKQMSVRDVHPKKDLKHVISEFEAQARGEKTLAQNIPCLRKDGKILYADVNSARVAINGKECNVGFFTDITERKEKEKELYETEAKYRTLVEQIPAVTYIAALDSASTTLYVSPQIETLVGFSLREYKKDPDIWRKQLHPDDRERVMAEVERSHAGGEQFCCEYRMLARDGHVIWFHDEGVLVRDSKNRPLFLQGVMFDISVRKLAEEALCKARDELEVRVEQRTEELRALTLELSLAEERLTSSQQLTESLEEIRDLIAQTINSTRSLTFELSPPVLYELGFEAAVEWLVRHTREQHGLSAEFEDDGKRKQLDNDTRILLFQAVRELLVNIVKHAKARNVKVLTQMAGDEIQVVVEDDGVGFEIPKTRIDKDKQEGFGLFSIRERLDHIGGQMKINSRRGRGTRITLVAPTNQKNKK
ncbi:MAG: PAS domain-containing sensor histidine kinase, partial [Planctomycetota bacterium]